MLKIDKNNIYLTRGDSAAIQIYLEDTNGDPYTPVEGDEIRFALKRNYEDFRCLIKKPIPTDTLMLNLTSTETEKLDFGKYYYDIQLTRLDGTVDTFIDRALFISTEEVD